MAANKIRVLIVDDIAETRENIRKLLQFESDVEVIGTARSGKEGIQLSQELDPDVVLMDINMPDIDGISAAEQLAVRAPRAAVIMMSVQGEADYLRRSMLAGAREFLVKPFSSDELTASIRQVHQREREKLSRMTQEAAGAATAPVPTQLATRSEPGQLIAVFSPKGGVGRTTIAANVAIAAAADLGKKVILVDGSFQFGDVGVLLDLNPKNKSIADLVPDLEGGDPDSLEPFIINHSSGIRVLLAPPTPEMAELVTAPAVRRILELLRMQADIVVVDCMSSFNDTTLMILDEADIILTVLSLEITSIKNMRLFLEVADHLGYQPGKVRLVLNRADAALGIRVPDVEQSLGRKVDHTIVSDGRSVVYALNRGVPFYLSNREAPVSQDILKIAQGFAGDASPGEATPKAAARKSLFARR